MHTVRIQIHSLSVVLKFHSKVIRKSSFSTVGVMMKHCPKGSGSSVLCLMCLSPSISSSVKLT